ncbi:PMP22 isoform 2 [Pongo abelii]|uniref:PMP22 isoform 2 n=2 Tax=Pongo abelii TaxID=9601 RepID=A0A0A0MXP3_PONAB|nr:PMP22 isoform 2 [Pongo abelii]
MAAVCPGHHDPVDHLQHSVSVPVLLPTLHPHQGGQILHHWNLPNSCWSVRDERCGHLHGEAPGVASQLGLLLRLRLHLGVGGLPPGPSQRCHLRDLAETRMRRPDGLSEALSVHREGRKGNQKAEKEKRASPKSETQTKPNRKQWRWGLLLIEDVYNISGL